MTTPPLTLDSLKRQARRMRDHFAEHNIEMSHSKTLEALAKQYGYKDWNVLTASLKRQALQPIWPTLEDRVSGTYLGHDFTASILKTETAILPDVRRYTLLFDVPIDVVASTHFSNFRQRVTCLLNSDLRSVDHKGRPDNIVQLNK
ncbi:glyoxalase superfamily protein [Paremcibacter congregatus]|uniref:glyoxalase superfamily protein n=1 Tax=Paremcibacter congregatus TaxID=2043170 RepID=UPI003A8E55AC|tara:strand:+ start:432 stop:869 length:438 start_codon:yes stop_codon:yes gene_type:complete